MTIPPVNLSTIGFKPKKRQTVNRIGYLKHPSKTAKPHVPEWKQVQVNLFGVPLSPEERQALGQKIVDALATGNFKRVKVPGLFKPSIDADTLDLSSQKVH